MRIKLVNLSLIALLLLVGCVAKKMVRGEYYLSEEKYQNGIAYFHRYLKKAPEDPQAHYYLGRLYLADGQHHQFPDDRRGDHPQCKGDLPFCQDPTVDQHEAADNLRVQEEQFQGDDRAQ